VLGDFNKVTVIEGSWSPSSRCSIKTCNSKAKFMVFNDDGEPKMSRLFSTCCGKHLPLTVRRAWAENRERAKARES